MRYTANTFKTEGEGKKKKEKREKTLI